MYIVNNNAWTNLALFKYKYKYEDKIRQTYVFFNN